MVYCEKCGFCYADTLATLEDYDNYYNNYNYYSISNVDNSLNNLSKDSIKEIFNNNFNKEDRILDVGFGKAELLLNLHQEGFYKIYGVDPSIESVENAKKHGIKAYVGSIYRLQEVIDEKMDVIILTGVLEHLLKPALALKCISKCIKEGGHLVIGVPNCENLNFDNTPVSNNFNQEHINYFSKLSLCNMMSKNGFNAVKIIDDKNYVDIFAIFKYSSVSKDDIKLDTVTRASIENYLHRQEKETEQYNKKLKPYIDENNQILVWGTGAFTMNLLLNSDLQKCNIAAFIDNNPLKYGSELYNKQIVSPKDINKFAQAKAIVICCFKDAESIKHQIQEMNCSKEIIVL